MPLKLEGKAIWAIRDGKPYYVQEYLTTLGLELGHDSRRLVAFSAVRFKIAPAVDKFIDVASTRDIADITWEIDSLEEAVREATVMLSEREDTYALASTLTLNFSGCAGKEVASPRDLWSTFTGKLAAVLPRMKRLRSLTIQAVRGKPGEYPSFAAELATIIRHNPECVISVDRLTITTGFESLANAFMSLKEIEFCGHDHSSEGVRYVGNAQSVVSKATECQQLTILKCMAFDKVAAVGISQLEEIVKHLPELKVLGIGRESQILLKDYITLLGGLKHLETLELPFLWHLSEDLRIRYRSDTTRLGPTPFSENDNLGYKDTFEIARIVHAFVPSLKHLFIGSPTMYQTVKVDIDTFDAAARKYDYSGCVLDIKARKTGLVSMFRTEILSTDEALTKLSNITVPATWVEILPGMKIQI